MHVAPPFAALPKHREVRQKSVNAGLPARLKIPEINVDAALDHVGLTPKGDLDSPKDPARGAWYRRGPRPGDTGNAVIDGHFGYKNRTPAVFDNLHKLRQGDNIYVEDEMGVTTIFTVRELRSYDPEENTAEVFSPRDGTAHLNLITCEGTWDKARKRYPSRLVVFADKTIE